MENLNTIFKQSRLINTNMPSKSSPIIGHVALLSGGMSSERFVSLSSNDAIEQALLANNYKVSTIDPGSDIGCVLEKLAPDLVYNNLYGTYGEDGCLPGLLNMMHIPYTHSGLQASSIAFNKLTTRKFLASSPEVVFSDAIVVKKTDRLTNDPMPRPYVIKPLCQGSSVGIQIIMQEDSYDFASYDFAYGPQVLIEKYVKGREIQVAVLDGKALGALEIKVLKNRFYDYQTKYSDGFAQHLMPAPLTQSQSARVLRIAERVYEAIGCRGIARVEFLYDQAADIFYFLEINTHPGMTNLSICPEIAAYVGIDFNQLVRRIIQGAKYEE